MSNPRLEQLQMLINSIRRIGDTASVVGGQFAAKKDREHGEAMEARGQAMEAKHDAEDKRRFEMEHLLRQKQVEEALRSGRASDDYRSGSLDLQNQQQAASERYQNERLKIAQEELGMRREQLAQRPEGQSKTSVSWTDMQGMKHSWTGPMADAIGMFGQQILQPAPGQAEAPATITKDLPGGSGRASYPATMDDVHREMSSPAGGGFDQAAMEKQLLDREVQAIGQEILKQQQEIARGDNRTGFLNWKSRADVIKKLEGRLNELRGQANPAAGVASLQQQAEAIRQAYQAGKMSQEQAAEALRALQDVH